MKTVKLMIATVMMAQIATTAHADFARVKKASNVLELENSKDYINAKSLEDLKKFWKKNGVDINDMGVLGKCFWDDKNKKSITDTKQILSCKNVAANNHTEETIVLYMKNKGEVDALNNAIAEARSNTQSIRNSNESTKVKKDKKSLQGDSTNHKRWSKEENDKALIEFRNRRLIEAKKYQAAPAAAKVSTSAR